MKSLFIAVTVVYMSLLPVKVSGLVTYMFEAVLPKDKAVNVETTLLEKSQGLFTFGQGLLYSMNITYVNLTTGIFHFNITWRELYIQRLGDPVDVVRIANEVHEYMVAFDLKPIKLRMKSRPGPPTSLSASDVKLSSFIVNWKHPEHFDVDSYILEISNGSTNTSWENTTTIDGSQESIALNDLKPETTYHIKMESVNGYGRGQLKSKVLTVKTKGHSTAKKPIVYISVIVTMVVVLTVLAIGVVSYWRRKQAVKKNPYKDSILGVNPSHIYMQDTRIFCPTGNPDGSNNDKYFSWNEISRDSVIMDYVLGEGEFGQVVKAKWRNEKTDTDTNVAVKTVKDVATDEDKKELFKELKLMADLDDHPNIVNLVGACSRGGPLWVIVEFCEHGNLLSFLKQNRKELPGNENPFVSSLHSLTRARIACDVAKGMSYLEAKKVVHRDLAARNVLLGKNKIAKVSDFGLSRDVYEVGLYQKKTGGKLPVKWMAIESLQEATYTSKSDIWSFGVLFWEIETAGKLPYPGISGLDLLKYLQRGYRLPKPEDTLPEMYTLMTTSWDPNPEERPSFKDLESTLSSYMDQNSSYLQVLGDDEDYQDQEDDARYENYIQPLEF